MHKFIKEYRETLPPFLQTMPIKGEPTRYMPRSVAMQFERFKGYLNDRHFLMTDLDKPVSLAHWMYDLEPNFICYNSENGNHQAFWKIKDAVHCQESARSRAPYRYLRAIEAGYDQKYGTDPHFARHIHRNPLFHSVDTDWRHDKTYSLSELAEPIALPELSQKRLKTAKFSPIISSADESGRIVRNKSLFDDVRLWAYKNTTKHTEYQPLYSQILTRILALNAFEGQSSLQQKECAYIAKSIADFMFYRYKPESGREITDEFRQIQSKRGKIGGKKSKGGGRPTIDKKLLEEIQRLRNVHKYSIRKIAIELGISKTAVSKYAK